MMAVAMIMMFIMPVLVMMFIMPVLVMVFVVMLVVVVLVWTNKTDSPYMSVAPPSPPPPAHMRNGVWACTAIAAKH